MAKTEWACGQPFCTNTNYWSRGTEEGGTSVQGWRIEVL